ncbi:NAD-dependent epimerase/dehydratase family protein [Microaerobacter geothermalis]|uniref:NAD-dependent epimerase/dehydratase family protein n=1 Tax=Microaerobacter geothermalis TaxID=674972 RepID=UPI001F20B681|nr:NAD-dependent epimerase/dehydratase family protein [Microaerobacter geothermalis]MCF6095026.1 NAD-dependent epimerase/dehydratase family protein [Microaerobacter geothermalis]
MSKKTALVLGATGLIGSELVKILIQQNKYEKIHLLVRRSIGVNHSTCEEHVIDFDHLDEYSHLFHVTDVFCCLGTTIKTAKSKEAFRKVDYVYPVEAAKLSKQFHVDKFLIVTAMGSNPKSPIFYNRVKGEVEETLRMLKLRSLHIFRPSLLLGDRKEFRLGEKLMGMVSHLLNVILVGPLRPYRAIEANKVALAMAASANTNKTGVNIYPSHEIERMANEVR